ncbi:MAG TPA: hypothetical protein ENF81_08460 [Thermotogaceae bacterium]|nr:hypothetical protein [Thermotogaceae bacterium]
MPRKKNNKALLIEQPKSPEEIIFVSQDAILEPYPKSIKIESYFLEEALGEFKEYLQNGIAWAKAEWKKKNASARYPSEALCVNNLRIKVKEWREEGYPDVTETTRYLLEYWFENPREKTLWYSQRESVETLIYLYEVEGMKKVSELIKKYGALTSSLDEKYDKYPRYAFRMATGTGKTLVMAILTVWSYFNYLFEDPEEYSRYFLYVAPNLVVYDRLKRDLQELSIFFEFDLIPPEWTKDFKIQVITRDAYSDADRFPPPDEDGVIFVTNIHQIGKRTTEKPKEDAITLFTNLMNPGKDPYKESSIKLWDILSNYSNIMILKDEAHHIHREMSQWQKYIWDLHDELLENFGKGVFMELDFSATPKNDRGELFPWVIVDFSLREALQTGIVKYPAKVIVHDAPPVKRGASLDELMPYVRAALERWRIHKKKLKELGKKAVLFIMADKIEDALEIYKLLLNEPDISKQNMMLIHSELDKWSDKIKTKIMVDGEEKVIDKDLALELVRNLDEPDNPIEVISSVMMLNEGWDVRSVTVILGLRSYASQRQVLPEQVIGRGLRKLFPDEGIDTERWLNLLEIVGPSRLLEIIDSLETMEGIKIVQAPEKSFISFNVIHEPDFEMKLTIPKTEYISYEDFVDVDKIVEEIYTYLPKRKYNVEEIEDFAKRYDYEVVDKDGRILDEGTFIASSEYLPQLKLYQLAEELEREIPLPHSYSKLIDMLHNYIENSLFNGKINNINDDVLKYLYIKGWYAEVKKEILKLAKTYLENPTLISKVSVSKYITTKSMEGFPWTKEFEDSEKSLFIRISYEEGEERRIKSSPVDNGMEVDFVRFLKKATDVISFVKNIPRKPWAIYMTYYDSRKRRWSRFYPDFIVKAKDGYYIVETKGREEIQVPKKNLAAYKWCEAVSKATGENWKYLYLNSKEDWLHKTKICKLAEWTPQSLS